MSPAIDQLTKRLHGSRLDLVWEVALPIYCLVGL